MSTTEQFKKTIKEYLENRAAGDELFAKSYAKENKSIDECINFILQQVQKSGCNGFTDEEVYGMAIHYYDEDSIKDVAKPSDCHVLESVDEFKEEGDKMHHCVFDCEYFNRKDCLILSARNKKTGKRIETIELSLSTFEIIQQRAKCNGESPYKAEIKDLIINNIGQFKKLVIKKAM